MPAAGPPLSPPRPDPATVSELAERLDMGAAHASLVVGELARSGLAELPEDDAERFIDHLSLLISHIRDDA